MYVVVMGRVGSLPAPARRAWRLIAVIDRSAQALRRLGPWSTDKLMVQLPDQAAPMVNIPTVEGSGIGSP